MKTLALSALILLLAGCAQFNVQVVLGGTGNQVPITKQVRDGKMLSTSAQSEANTHETSLPVSVTQ